MRRLILLVTILSLSAQSFASTCSTQGLAASLEEIEYRLSVEWDQKDPKTFAEILRSFSAQTSCATSSEVLQLTLTKIPNENLRDQLSQRLKVISGSGLTSDELFEFLREVQDLAKDHGASWTGGIGEDMYQLSVFGTVVLAVAIAASIANQASRK